MIYNSKIFYMFLSIVNLFLFHKILFLKVKNILLFFGLNLFLNNYWSKL